MLHVSVSGVMRLINEGTLTFSSTPSIAGFTLGNRYNSCSINDQDLLFTGSLRSAPAATGVLRVKKSTITLPLFFAANQHVNLTCDMTHIYVSDSANQVITKRDLSFVLLNTSGVIGGSNFGVSTDGTFVYCFSTATHTLLVLKCSDLSVVSSRIFLVAEPGYLGLAVMCDLNFVYLFTTVVAGNSQLIKINKSTLATVTVGTLQNFVRASSSTGLTSDGTNIYMVGDTSNTIGKFDIGTCNLISFISSATYGGPSFAGALGMYSDKWYDMMYLTPQYVQIVGGGSSRRYKPRPGLYTPFNSDIL